MPKSMRTSVAPIRLSPKTRDQLAALLGDHGPRFADKAELILEAVHAGQRMDRASGTPKEHRDIASRLSKMAGELASLIDSDLPADLAALIGQESFMVNGSRIDWDALSIRLHDLSLAAEVTRDEITPRRGAPESSVTKIIRHLAPSFVEITGRPSSWAARSIFPTVVAEILGDPTVKAVILDDPKYHPGDVHSAIKAALRGVNSKKKR